MCKPVYFNPKPVTDRHTIDTYMHTYMHTYIQTYKHTYIQAQPQTKTLLVPTTPVRLSLMLRCLAITVNVIYVYYTIHGLTNNLYLPPIPLVSTLIALPIEPHPILFLVHSAVKANWSWVPQIETSEWSRPLCSRSHIGSWKGPKPVVVWWQERVLTWRSAFSQQHQLLILR